MDPLEAGEKAGTLLTSGATGIISVLIAVIVILAGIIVYLYRKLEAAADKRAETAGRVEGALAANKTAIEALVKSIEATDASSDDRFETTQALPTVPLFEVEVADMQPGNRSAHAVFPSCGLLFHCECGRASGERAAAE